MASESSDFAEGVGDRRLFPRGGGGGGLSGPVSGSWSPTSVFALYWEEGCPGLCLGPLCRPLSSPGWVFRLL